MKAIYKPCEACKGKGSLPIYTNLINTTGNVPFISHNETCKVCDGKGYIDEILGYIEN
jgi:DnaJ-class molecular chaperone